MLIESDICVEVCPISNRMTGAVGEIEEHPITKFVKGGVPFVISSDNPAIHCSGLVDDYIEFYNLTQCGKSIKNMLDQQKKYSFLEGT